MRWVDMYEYLILVVKGSAGRNTMCAQLIWPSRAFSWPCTAHSPTPPPPLPPLPHPS